MRDFAIGCDIGGSHVSCGLVNLKCRRIEPDTLVQRSLDNQQPADAILRCWADALSGVLRTVDPERLAGIGFAMPGPFNYETGIALFSPEVAKYQSLHGLDISKRIRALLGLEAEISLRYMNDALCFGVGEAWAGKASSVTRSICVTLGTGFGSAFVEDGAPVVEGVDVPENGCLWHLPFRDGIADEVLSARWFSKEYTARAGETAMGVQELAKKSSSEPVAKALFEEFGANLGTFLAPWQKKFGAEALVIGGNISRAYPLFGSTFEEALATQEAKVPVHISVLLERAALLGSSRLFEDSFWTRVRPLLLKM
jgi:glucokinase